MPAHLRIVQKSSDPNDNVVAKIMTEEELDNEEVVAAAKHLLQSAQNGDIRGFAVVCLAADGKTTGSYYTETCEADVHSTIGGIEIMKQRFIEGLVDD